MPIELTILMPCLNEAETLARCIRKAHLGAREAGATNYEILVADNGSTDGSQAIAECEGARVIHVPLRGYGAALQSGIQHAQGKYVLMGDSDDSYDFSQISPFVEQLRAGAQLVMGSCFKGEIRPGAMPFLHQYLGNPILTFLGNLFFRTGFSDFHCGIRAFEREAILRLSLQTTGMEYASEMVIRATLMNLRRAEVPTVLSPDGRSRPPHLRRWRDGWRHLRFMLLYSPRWVFVYPGILLTATGVIGTLLLAPGPLTVGSVVFDVHSMLILSTLGVVGLQLIFVAIFARVYSIRVGMLPPQPHLERFTEQFSLGIGLTVGIILIVAGILFYAREFLIWSSVNLGPLNYQITMRSVIIGTMLLVAGLQLFFWSFIVSILGLPRRTA